MGCLSEESLNNFCLLHAICSPLPVGVPWPDGHSRPHPLCAQPPAHYCPHTGRVCVPGPSIQWPDLHFHLSADQGAVESGGWAAGSLLHGHCPGYISRSVAGSFDNEGIAIFALQFTYYLWVRLYMLH